jgi:hypothetical protein
VFDPLAIVLIIATNQAFNNLKPKPITPTEPEPIQTQPVFTQPDYAEQEKARILHEIQKIQNSGISGRKSGPVIEDLHNKLRDLDNTKTY